MTQEERLTIIHKLQDVANAARLVVPTSEKCPLIKPLQDLDDYIEEVAAKEFKRGYESK